MAHIGLLCPPVAGHLNAVATLGRCLIQRGHRVTAFQIPAMKSQIEAHGLEFGALGEGQDRTREMAEAVAKFGTLTGFAAMRFSVDCGRRLARIICENAPSAIADARIDLLIVDQNEPAGGSVAEKLKLPFVNVCSLPLNREPDMPPPFVPWSYSGTALNRIRNRIAYRVFDTVIAPVNQVLNEYRSLWNLPLVHCPDDTFSRLAQLSQLTADFDFPRKSQTANLRYLGPFYDDRRPHVSFPYERLNGKLLVYGSFGTLINRREQSFHTLAAACAQLDVQLVISTGRGTHLQQDDLPGAPIVVEYAPQVELLARATACITHAGLNTVMECLSHAVPMVAIPVTNDQPAVAARLRWNGAAEVLPSPQLTVRRLQQALLRVLEMPDYRRNAQRLQTSISQAGGVTKAAEIVEQFL